MQCTTRINQYAFFIGLFITPYALVTPILGRFLLWVELSSWKSVCIIKADRA